uniref:uncharacterized protein LOC120819549 isoform X1 n=1 Tax=Gasterosteus aculeatus aculeatus TaxID=481459 RepID=UPI001A9A1313|nr:uncharacterized protein LOC120819549 isoform X1 [Gasterosteus aculeatus aculeatus]
MYKTPCSRLSGVVGVSLKQLIQNVPHCNQTARCLIQLHKRDPSRWLTYQHLNFLKRQYVTKNNSELHQRAAQKAAPCPTSVEERDDNGVERRVQRIPTLDPVLTDNVSSSENITSKAPPGISTSEPYDDAAVREDSALCVVGAPKETPHVHVETDEAKEARLDRQWKQLKVDGAQLPDIYAKLAKIKLTALVVTSAAAGYAMAPVPFDPVIFVVASLGTCLASCSANSINQAGSTVNSPTQALLKVKHNMVEGVQEQAPLKVDLLSDIQILRGALRLQHEPHKEPSAGPRTDQSPPRRVLCAGVRSSRSGSAHAGGKPADGLPGGPQHLPLHLLLHPAQEAQHRQHLGGGAGGRHTSSHGLDGRHRLPGAGCSADGWFPVLLAVPPLQRPQLELEGGLLARRLPHDVRHPPGHVQARGPAPQPGPHRPVDRGARVGRHHLDLPRHLAAHQPVHQLPGLRLLSPGRPQQRPQAVLLQPLAPAHAAAAGAHVQEAPGGPGGGGGSGPRTAELAGFQDAPKHFSMPSESFCFNRDALLGVFLLTTRRGPRDRFIRLFKASHCRSGNELEMIWIKMTDLQRAHSIITSVCDHMVGLCVCVLYIFRIYL